MNEDMKNFIEFLEENDISKNTIDNYKYDILICLRDSCIIEKKEDENQSYFTIFKKYIDEMKETDKLKSTSLNRKIASFNRFLNFLGDKNKIKYIKIIQQTIIADLLTINDVNRILKYSDLRTKALIAILLRTGARISEVLQIKRADILQNKTRSHVKGKGNKYRDIFITKKLNKILKEYIHDTNPQHKKEYLFSFSRWEANKILKTAAGKARVKKTKVHCHSFRNLFSVQLMKANIPQPIIKQILGHRLNLTERYMQISQTELFKTIDNIKIEGI